MPKNNKKEKPPFFEWVLTNPTAFRVTSIISIFMGLIISVLMLIISFVMDYMILFKILFICMTIYQIIFTMKAWAGRNNINNTIEAFTYKGKFTNNNPDIPKEDKK